MGEQNNSTETCVKMALEFLKDANSVRVLEIIIDIYDEIKYSKMNRKTVSKRFLRVLYNLINSDSLHSLLEKDDIEILSSFLQDFLQIGCDSSDCFIGNEEFNKLTLDEIYNVLIETKYLKEMELKKISMEAL